MENKKYIDKVTQYGGFVKNMVTGEYECLFTTFSCKLLAHNRAKEKAAGNNKFINSHYDINDIVIYQRSVEYTTGDWK